MSIAYLPQLINGHLGLYVNTSTVNSTLMTLLQKSALLNPVIGMWFDPVKLKLTVGALNPADYEGKISWVQMETAGPIYRLRHQWPIGGNRF